MIRSLRIRNFKSIVDTEIEFGAVNVFIGDNAAGKSNVLEAIALYAACLGRGIDRTTLSAKGVRVSNPRMLSSAFRDNTPEQRIDLNGTVEEMSYDAGLRLSRSGCELEFASERLEVGTAQVCERVNGKVQARGKQNGELTGSVEAHAQHGLWATHRPSAHMRTESARDLDDAARYAVYQPASEALRGLQQGKRNNETIGLTGAGLERAMRAMLMLNSQKGQDKQRTAHAFQMLSKAGIAVAIDRTDADPQAQRKVSARIQEAVCIIDKHMQTGRHRISLEAASEGALHLLFATALLEQPEAPPIFAAENIDGPLSPTMARAMTEEIVRRVCQEKKEHNDRRDGPLQVFLVTNKPTALDAIDLFENKQRLFVVRRNEQRHTMVDRIRRAEGITKPEWTTAMKGRNLSQLWLDGRLTQRLGT